MTCVPLQGGCITKLEQFLADHLLLMGAVGLGVACLQVSWSRGLGGSCRGELQTHLPLAESQVTTPLHTHALPSLPPFLLFCPLPSAAKAESCGHSLPQTL